MCQVDSVASLNDIAERDMAEILQSMQRQRQRPQPMQYFYDHPLKQSSSMVPQREMMSHSGFSTPVQTPLRNLSLNHQLNTPDAFGQMTPTAYAQSLKQEKVVPIVIESLSASL